MNNPVKLEEAFQKFMKGFPKTVPDGIITVDLKLLNDLDLLHCGELSEENSQEEFPHHFHVIETQDKVTLFNDLFGIWIVPKLIDEIPTTFVLISMIRAEELHLEVVFSTAGIYNTPKFVLKVLRYYLTEVIETEETISSMGREG